MLRKFTSLVAILLLSSSLSAAEFGMNYRGNLFLEMMLTMMEMMGFIDRDNDYYNQPYPNYNSLTPFSYGYSGNSNPWQTGLQSLAWQQLLNNPGMSGWGGGLPGLTPLPPVNGLPGIGGLAGPGGLNPWDPAAAGMPWMQSSNPWAATRKHWIEGRWQAVDGMLLIVQQGEFRMFYPEMPNEVRTGLIRIKDHWLAIFEQSTQTSQQYEFAYQDDYLVLRDDYGNMMLFRKLIDWPMPLR